MAYRKVDLGHLVISPRSKDREEAGKKILAAYERAGGIGARAADDLGVNFATLWRWVARLGLADAVVKIRKKHGATAA